MTHTYALLEVSKTTYDEITQLLKAAGYEHVFHHKSDALHPIIDMSGIALVQKVQTIVVCLHCYRDNSTSNQQCWKCKRPLG